MLKDSLLVISLTVSDDCLYLTIHQQPKSALVINWRYFTSVQMQTEPSGWSKHLIWNNTLRGLELVAINFKSSLEKATKWPHLTFEIENMTLLCCWVFMVVTGCVVQFLYWHIGLNFITLVMFHVSFIALWSTITTILHLNKSIWHIFGNFLTAGWDHQAEKAACSMLFSCSYHFRLCSFSFFKMYRRGLFI